MQAEQSDLRGPLHVLQFSEHGWHSPDCTKNPAPQDFTHAPFLRKVEVGHERQSVCVIP